MKQIIYVTKTAGKQLAKIAKENNVNNILFYVKGGGCNGFNYKLEAMNTPPQKLDEIIHYDDYNIIVDKTSVMFLLGTIIDWKKNIMGESFHFTNPTAVANCGCGTSFSV